MSGTSLPGDITIDLKSVSVLGTDSNGLLIEGTSTGGGGVPASKAIDAYGYQAVSETGTHKYWFFEDGEGAWYIRRKNLTTLVHDFAKGTGGYATVYVNATSAPSGSPTFASYDATFANTGAGSLSFDTDNYLQTSVMVTDELGVRNSILGDTLYAGAPVVMDVEHHEIHCGDSFVVTRSVDLGNGATDTLIINVPNEAVKLYHMTININTESESDFNIYEGATTAADGTTLTSYNRNRNNALTSSLVITHTPTTPSGGTLIYTEHWGAGKSSGGETRGQQEFILKNNTKYRVTITNSTTTNNYVSWKLNYYIHPGV